MFRSRRDGVTSKVWSYKMSSGGCVLTKLKFIICCKENHLELGKLAQKRKKLTCLLKKVGTAKFTTST